MQGQVAAPVSHCRVQAHDRVRLPRPTHHLRQRPSIQHPALRLLEQQLQRLEPAELRQQPRVMRQGVVPRRFGWPIRGAFQRFPRRAPMLQRERVAPNVPVMLAEIRPQRRHPGRLRIRLDELLQLLDGRRLNLVLCLVAIGGQGRRGKCRVGRLVDNGSQRQRVLAGQRHFPDRHDRPDKGAAMQPRRGLHRVALADGWTVEEEAQRQRAEADRQPPDAQQQGCAPLTD